jgi:NAD(P)-dependent dehydrogenase (short-subunit alcohol dehydrogenase family)
MTDAPLHIAGVRPGLRALVTAGAAGIGRAIADTLIEHGARVMACDIDAAALDHYARAHPGHPTAKADVGVEAEVDALFEAIGRELGGLDLLVNNAGIAGPTAGVEAIDPAEWRRTVDVNLTGQFYCLRRAVPHLKETAGSIINIASVAGRLGYAYRLPYAATKWAIVGMTESLSIELGPFGIRVNAILPGIVEGPRIDRVIGARAQELGLPFAEMRERYLQKTALGRMVTAQDVANMAVFLCSSMGANISGQALSVCAHVTNL